MEEACDICFGVFKNLAKHKKKCELVCKFCQFGAANKSAKARHEASCRARPSGHLSISAKVRISVIAFAAAIAVIHTAVIAPDEEGGPWQKTFAPYKVYEEGATGDPVFLGERLYTTGNSLISFNLIYLNIKY